MTTHIKKILYATDLSKNSSYALFYAVDMASRYDARIVILHAIEPIPPHIMGRLEGYDYQGALKNVQLKRREEEIEEIKNRIQEFCKKGEDQVGHRCLELISKIMVPLGHPVEEILNAANQEECDAIVLGTHGKGFLAHTFLGSVSSGVLHRTLKPIFIIPVPSEKAAIDLGEI